MCVCMEGIEMQRSQGEMVLHKFLFLFFKRNVTLYFRIFFLSNFHFNPKIHLFEITSIFLHPAEVKMQGRSRSASANCAETVYGASLVRTFCFNKNAKYAVQETYLCF